MSSSTCFPAFKLTLPLPPGEEANPVGQPAPRAKSATAQPSAQKKKRRADEDEDEGSEEDRDFEEGVDPAAGGDEGEEDEEELPDLRPKGRKKQRVDSPEEDEEE